ncbi:porin [Amaricoccus sp.]|uniref:porin n=1 Tax=Amaricoccus sp. TaxID=1872485 RepID=UPI001B54280C|nr:porin [Amaricoccus sp.]MBP7241648.1 porin [Amaricoccus sp.]
MKKILFASTALAALAVGGAASAEIALFGSARLGIGYNIDNEGNVDLEAVTSQNAQGITVVDRWEGTEDLRAVSRIRFGVTMTGESDSGITFGATIRADNANQGGTSATAATGQLAGEVFVSGAWGTLTYGDTNGADEQNVGDAIGNVALTGLGDFNETPYFSNGGGFGDDAIQFANNPEARPTVRYDYNFMGVQVSASTNRTLNDVGVGASYTYEFDEGSVTGGVGYYDFQEFTTTFAGIPGLVEVKGGEQWSVGATGTFGGFSAGVVYTAASMDSNNDLVSGDLDVIIGGLGYTWDAWTLNAYYANVMTGNGSFEYFDGNDSYGASVQYDLGGGASVNFGVAQTYGRAQIGDRNDVIDSYYAAEIEDATVADFGIKMAF